MSGHLFVFRNREEDKVKMLWWDRDGYAIFYKRLEKGTFAIPESVAAGVEMDSTTLSLLLSGINLERVRKQDRYTNGARKERAKIGSNLPGGAEQRSTMCDWVAATASLLRPLYERMKVRVLESRIVWTDDTPVKLQDRQHARNMQEGRIRVHRGCVHGPCQEKVLRSADQQQTAGRRSAFTHPGTVRNREAGSRTRK